MSTTAAPPPVEQQQTAGRPRRAGRRARPARGHPAPTRKSAPPSRPCSSSCTSPSRTTAFALPAGASTWIFTSSSFAIMAVVVALLMIGGEFDLSAGAMTGTTGLITGIMMSHWHVNVWVSVFTSLVVALCIGFLNGLLVMKTGLPSFIVTLGTFFVLRGVNLAGVKKVINQVSVVDFQSAQGLRRRQQAVRLLHQGRPDVAAVGQRPGHRRSCASMPPPGGRSRVIILATWVLQRTQPGNWIFAVGGAQTSARQVGVPVFRTKVGLFMTTAFGAWMVGMLTLFKTTTAQSTTGCRPGVRLHHLCRRRWLPADRWLRLRGRRGPRRPHLRDGRPGHRLRRLGQRLAVLHPRRDAPGRRPGQQLRQVASGESAMSAERVRAGHRRGRPGPRDRRRAGAAAARHRDHRGHRHRQELRLGDRPARRHHHGEGRRGDLRARRQRRRQVDVHQDPGGGARAHQRRLRRRRSRSGRFSSPREALALGIATVYQDLAVVPLMPVWRNFFLGSELTKGKGPTSRLDVGDDEGDHQDRARGDGDRPARRRAADRDPVRWRAAVRRDRPRGLLRCPRADPRRADRRARRPPVRASC